MHFAEDRLVRSWLLQAHSTPFILRMQGQERVKLLYAFRDIVNYGARLTLGSDAPVEDMNPLSGFFAAITRLAPDGTSPHGSEGWYVTLVESEGQSLG